MKINLAKSAGFCFGVKRAIGIAIKTGLARKNVYMLGDIVHNEDVVKMIQSRGIKKTTRLANGKGKTFLIRAHGMDQKTYRKVSRLGYAIIDATCPMVKEIHKIAQCMEKQCRDIIVIGDKEHDEVRGIIGQLKGKAIVIEDSRDISASQLNAIKKACVIVQSTQNIEKALKILNELRGHIKDLKFFNTICRPTRLKQEEIRKMPLKNDVMVIIGSRKSANTKRLYEISKSLNKRTYWVNSSGDIKNGWFKGAKSAGITAGASTPDSTTQEIIARIKQIN